MSPVHAPGRPIGPYAKEDSHLLDILIPSNNRRVLLEKQVVRLHQLLLSCPGLDARVLISETSSLELRPSDLIRQYESRSSEWCMTYLFSPAPFLTAEEHFLRRLELVNADYCWVLSDDDEPCIEGLVAMSEVLPGKKYGYLLFDSYTTSSAGRNATPRFGFPNGLTEFAMADIVIEYGFWHVMAGLSCTVFRAHSSLAHVLGKHLEISPIYAHVTSFVELFSRESCCTIGEALNWYKVDPYHDSAQQGDEPDMDNWEGFSLKHGCSLKYPWTLGFSSLLSLLLDGGYLDRAVISRIKDRNWERRYRWHVQVVEQIIYQCRDEIKAIASGSLSCPTLLHDSIRRPNNLDFDSFVRLWESVLVNEESAQDFSCALDLYRNIVSCYMYSGRDCAPDSVRALIGDRAKRLGKLFDYHVGKLERDYIAPLHWEVDLGSSGIPRRTAGQ